MTRSGVTGGVFGLQLLRLAEIERGVCGVRECVDVLKGDRALGQCGLLRLRV